jgi:hypothetical protein
MRLVEFALIHRKVQSACDTPFIFQDPTNNGSTTITNPFNVISYSEIICPLISPGPTEIQNYLDKVEPLEES